MDIQNISKKDREVTISLSADELVKICNTFYQTEGRKDVYRTVYTRLSDIMDDMVKAKIIRKRVI